MKTTIFLLFALILKFDSYTQIVTSGNIAKYYFNSGNPNDDIGTNDGIIYGAVLTEDRFGNPDKAFSFDHAFIRIDHNSELDLGLGDFSISAWFKTDNDENYCAIFNKGEGTLTKPRIFMRTMGTMQSTIQWRVGDGVNNVTTSHTDPTYFDNEWHHIVLTRNINHLFLYLDGVLIDITTDIELSTVNTNSIRPILLGVQDSVYSSYGNLDYSNYFDGSLDDFRIYNRAINDLEVDSLFKEENPIITSLKNVSNWELKLYPVPAKDNLSIDVDANLGVDRFEIYDTSGKLDQQGMITSKNIDIGNLKSGIYFIQLYANNELITSKKFLKEIR